MDKDIKIISHYWFNNKSGTIGIVVVHNGFEKKAYIKNVLGENMDDDLEEIVKWGNKFPISILNEIIEDLE